MPYRDRHAVLAILCGGFAAGLVPGLTGCQADSSAVVRSGSGLAGDRGAVTGSTTHRVTDDAAFARGTGGDLTPERLRALAEAGYRNAQYLLGRRLQLGDGMPQDLAAAARWFRLAAEQCQADAACSLGTMHQLG